MPGATESLVSPCVRNCCLDHKDVCLGCGRSLDEILEWSAADDGRRRLINATAIARLAAGAGVRRQ